MNNKSTLLVRSALLHFADRQNQAADRREARVVYMGDEQSARKV